MVGDIIDPRRSEPAFLLDERTMLEEWLEFHRLTLLLKCEGLDDAARKQRPVPTSLLSLHGLVRHMAEVERNWFQRTLAEDAGARPIWFSDENEDGDVAPLDDASWDDDFAVWQHECETSRRIAAEHSLDDTGMRRGEPCALRWIYLHMIEEYARHNGHADLIREMVDGSVGW
jgi:uncharacterized damage-inducible protein DinB